MPEDDWVGQLWSPWPQIKWYNIQMRYTTSQSKPLVAMKPLFLFYRSKSNPILTEVSGFSKQDTGGQENIYRDESNPMYIEITGSHKTFHQNIAGAKTSFPKYEQRRHDHLLGTQLSRQNSLQTELLAHRKFHLILFKQVFTKSNEPASLNKLLGYRKLLSKLRE